MINLDRLEKDLLEGDGNARDKLLRLYGKNLSYNSAVMYLAGMKLLLKNLKESLKQEDSNKEYETDAYKIHHHADKSKTIHQDIYLGPEEEATPWTVMKKMGLDPLAWEVLSCEILKGHYDVTMKMENSNIVDGEIIKTSTPLTVRNQKYSVKIRIKPIITKDITFPQVLSAFQELTPETLIEYDYDIPTLDGFLLEMPIMDFHFGKHCWHEESGSDYDLKIAEELWYESFTDLINKGLKLGKIDHILYPIGQDFFHFDTPGVTTTSGTQLNSDSRWEKVFRKGVEVLVWGVERLREIAPVEILWVPGNHDQMLSYAATVGLAQRYSETDNVKVDLSSAPRKYRLFGRNLIGYSHGEKEGKRLEGLMQVEAPEFWGQSIFREFHMGHLHSEMTTTKNGIIFRRISSITGTDAWHAENGFVGATRQAQAFLWHKTNGLQAILNSNVIKAPY